MVRPDKGLIIERALRAEARRMQFRLFRRLLLLYLSKLVLDFRQVSLRARRHLLRYFS